MVNIRFFVNKLFLFLNNLLMKKIKLMKLNPQYFILKNKKNRFFSEKKFID
jgi:hypothetical protein